MAVLDFIKSLFSSNKDVTQGDLLTEFRNQYPVYAKVTDPDLAKALSLDDPAHYGFLTTFDPKATVSPEVVPPALRDETFYSQHPDIGQKDAMATINEFKTKYPVYRKVENPILASALEKEYPTDMRFKGLAARLPATLMPSPTPPPSSEPAKSLTDIIDSSPVLKAAIVKAVDYITPQVPEFVDRIGRAQIAGSLRSAAKIGQAATNALAYTQPFSEAAKSQLTRDTINFLPELARRIEPQNQNLVEQISSGRFNPERLADALLTTVNADGKRSLITDQSIIQKAKDTGEVPYADIATRSFADGLAHVLYGFIPTNPVEAAAFHVTNEGISFLGKEIPALNKPISSLAKTFVDFVKNKNVDLTIPLKTVQDFQTFGREQLSPQDYQTLLKVPKENIVEAFRKGEDLKTTIRVPRFGETSGQTTIFEGTQPAAQPEPVNPIQPGLFGEQAKPAFEVSVSAIENAPTKPVEAPIGEQGVLPLQTTQTAPGGPPALPGEKPIKVDSRGIPVLQPTDVVSQVDVGQGNMVNITHQEVLDEAKNLLQVAHEQRVVDPLEQFVKENGGIAPIQGEGFEYKKVPVRLRGIKPADQMAQEAFNQGLLNEPKADVLINRIGEIKLRGKPPKLADFYEPAKRNLEYYAQEGVGAGTTSPQEAFFQSIGRVRRPSQGEATMGSQPIDKFEQIETPAMQKARSEFKLSDKARQIVEKYAGIVGERYTPRGAQGVFYPATNNIRVMALNNLSTVAHEVTHYLDHKLKVIDPLIKPIAQSKTGNPIYDPKYAKVRKRLTELYMEYYPKSSEDHPLETRMREGIATFFQKYVETPTKIKEKYGDLVNLFLKEGGEFYRPQFKEFVNDLQGIVSDYQNLDPLEKVGARVTSKFQQAEIRDSYLNFADKFITEIVNNKYPLEKLSKEAGKQRTIHDPSLWAYLYDNSTSLILQNIKGKGGFWIYSMGEFKKLYNENIGDLVETLQEKGLTDDFGKWLVARRQVFAYQKLDELKAPAIEAGRELESIQKQGQAANPMMRKRIQELKKIIESYKQLFDTLKHDGFDRTIVTKAYQDNANIFKPYADLFDKFTRANLGLLADPDVGLMTENQFQELVKQEGYASYKRDIYDEILGSSEPIQRKGAGGTKPSSLIRRKGSELSILNPLYSMIRDHAEIVRKSLKQIVINKVAALAENFPDLFQRLELKPAVDKKTGAISYPQERDPDILMARSANAERIPYLVSREIQEVVNDVLDYQNMHIFEKGMRAMNRIFTAGTTAFYPMFAPTNFLIDQITASAQTRTAYIPIYDSLAQVAKAILKRNSKEADFFHEYLVLGGERQTFSGWTNMQPDELMAKIAGEKTGLDKFLGALRTGTRILAMPSGYSEIATRASEYIKSRKLGNPQVVALEDAGRVTVPFHHIGRMGSRIGSVGKSTVGQTFVRSVPFFNPGIQAVAHYTRIIKNGDTRNRALFVTLATIASMVGSSYWIMKRATDTQRKLYRDLEPNELSMYLFLPSSDGKRLVRIRVDQVMGWAAALINMGMWDVLDKTDYTVGDYVSAATAFLPDQANITSPQRMFLSVMPQIIKPIVNVLYNMKDWPKPRPMVSMGLEQKEPRLQFNDNTSTFAKWLGNKFNLSPIKIDYLIENYLGRLSRPFIGKQITNPFMRDWYFTAGRNLSDYYEMSKVSDQLWNSYQTGGRKFTDQEVQKIIEQEGQVRFINKLLTAYRAVEHDTSVPGTQHDKNLEDLRNNILDEVAQFRQSVRK